MKKTTEKPPEPPELKPVIAQPVRLVASPPQQQIAASPLDAAIHFAQIAKRAQLASLAARVFAGLAATAAKKLLGIGQGTRTDLADDARLADGWEGFCKKHLGTSARIVSNWEKVAQLIGPKICKLNGISSDSLEHFMELADDEFEKLRKVVASACEGTTLTQALFDWKMLNGGNKSGGGIVPTDPAADTDTPPGWTEEEFTEYQEADATLRAAIDHARSVTHSLRGFTSAVELTPHIPQHYRESLKLAIATASEALALPPQI